MPWFKRKSIRESRLSGTGYYYRLGEGKVGGGGKGGFEGFWFFSKWNLPDPHVKLSRILTLLPPPPPHPLFAHSENHVIQQYPPKLDYQALISRPLLGEVTSRMMLKYDEWNTAARTQVEVTLRRRVCLEILRYDEDKQLLKALTGD